MGATGAAAMMGGAGLASLAGSYEQAKAQQLQGQWQRQQYDFNQRVAGLQADDATRRGDYAANQVEKKVNQTQGAQRSAAAANGVDVTSGSAAQLQDDTRQAGTQDEMTIRNNAWREAWGYKVQATNYGNQGAMSYAAGQRGATNSLLTGGMQALGYGAQAAGYLNSPRLPGGQKTYSSTEDY